MGQMFTFAPMRCVEYRASENVTPAFVIWPIYWYHDHEQFATKQRKEFHTTNGVEQKIPGYFIPMKK